MKKIAIYLFFIECCGILISYFLNIGVSIPALNTLNGMMSAVNGTAYNLAGVANYTLIPINPPSSSLLFGDSLGVIANIISWWINLGAKVIDFVIQIGVLFAEGVVIIAFTIFLIPSLLAVSSLGAFSVIFVIVDSLLPLVLGIYAFELITGIYRRVKP